MNNSPHPGTGTHPADALSQSDSSLARVLEDLIDVLITRGVIKFTDLPDAAQAKLMERRQTRVNLGSRLDLLDNEDPSQRLI